MRLKILAILFLLLAASIISTYIYVQQVYPQTEPKKPLTYVAEHIISPHVKLNKYALGFLPYWQLETIDSLKPQDLSEINYFGLSADYDGTILKETNGEGE